MKGLRNQRGVAMVTVLFIGAALTVVASAAAMVTVREFQAGADDRKGAEVLAFAEAGVERSVEVLRSGGVYKQDRPGDPDRVWAGIPSWGELNEAGCALGPLELPEGQLGEGRTYTVQLTVYDPTQPVGQRIPPVDPWSSSNDTSSPVCTSRKSSPKPTEDLDTDHLFAISSVGEHATAKRKVLQVLQIQGAGLPIGVFAEDSDNTGNPDFGDISLVTPGDVSGREKLSMKGLDPYYTMADFYGESFSDTEHIPAAVHAGGVVTCVSNCNSAGAGSGRKQEHPPSPNCEANGTSDGASEWQSLWDGSGLGTTITTDCPARPAGTGTTPPTALFDSEALKRVTPKPELNEDDHERLKNAAKEFGVYCTNIGSSYCTIEGAGPYALNDHMVWTDNMITTYGLTRFVAYFDFDPAARQTVGWKASVSPCSDDPAVNRAMVLVVRNGDVTTQGAGAGEAVGAFLIPEGEFDAAGKMTVHGTIIAQSFNLRGNGKFINSTCWVRNMPGAFLDYTPTHWSQVDR